MYGTCGLKVADLSLARGNVSANTYGTALIIIKYSVHTVATYYWPT